VSVHYVIFCYSVVGYQNICEELRYALAEAEETQNIMHLLELTKRFEELEFPDKDGVYKAALSLVARIMQDSFIKVSRKIIKS